MAKTYNRLNIEINQPINDIMTAVKDDTFSRFLDVFLFSNGTSIDLTDHKVRIYIKKPDGTEIYNQGTITDAPLGRVQFELTNQTLAVCGQLQCQIIIYNNEETQILSTEIFKIMVTKSLICEEAIESTNEYGALVVLYQNIYEALVLIEQVAENTKNCAKETSEYLIENKIKELELQLNKFKQEFDLSKGLGKLYINMDREYITVDTKTLNEEVVIFEKSGSGSLFLANFSTILTGKEIPQGEYLSFKIICDDEVILYPELHSDKSFSVGTAGQPSILVSYFTEINYRNGYYFFNTLNSTGSYKFYTEGPFTITGGTGADIDRFLPKKSSVQRLKMTFPYARFYLVEETPLIFKKNIKLVVNFKQEIFAENTNLLIYLKMN